MKNQSLTLPLLTATLFAVPALAADTAPAGAPASAPVMAPGGPGGRGHFREEMFRKFDQDGDGKLNDAEKAEAHKAREERSAQWGGHGQRGPGGPGRFRGHDGAGEPPRWMRRELHRWFEEKWGGQAGPGPHMMPHGPGGKIRGEIIKRFDKDGDGKLNEVERAEAKKAGEEMRARFQEHRKEVLARFDKDGDGKLGEAERKDQHAAWQKFIQQQPATQPASK